MNGKYNEEMLISKYTGSNGNKELKTDTGLNWRIWKVDDNKITLISDKTVLTGGYRNLGAISFANCNGYNNAVKILNDICLNCYSNRDLNAIARSINIDDIEGVLNRDVWRPEMYQYKKTESNTYSSRKEYLKTKCYPVIFNEEQYSIIDGTEKQEGIQRSVQDDLIDNNKAFMKAKNSINPLQTAWTKSKMSAKNFIDKNYYYMIFKDGNSEKDEVMSYFLASRAINLHENNAQFSLFEVSMGSTIRTNSLFNSLGGSIEYWDRIRPMVEIPIDGVRVEKINDGLTKDTAWKIEKKL